MKILQVVYNLASGGAERFAVDLCNELSKNNEVHLLTINDDRLGNNNHYRNDLSSQVTYHCLGCKKGICLDSIIMLYKAIKRISPDVVHTHTALINIYFPSLFFRKTKYVHTIHSITEKACNHLWLLKKIDKRLFKRYVQPVAISQVCLDSYISFFKNDNAILINNGCPPKQTTEKLEEVKYEIEKYKQNDNVPVFIHVARYSEAKNQKMLFETFLKLRENGYKFLLLVLGANYKDSGFIHLNNSNDIKIIGEKNNVGDYLAFSDYFVLSSLWEGLPISLIEAMSMGVIPICTPAGGVVNVIDDGKNGLLSPDFESESFYNTVNKVFSQDFHINREDTIKHYKRTYTMETCANNYLNTYKKETK